MTPEERLADIEARLQLSASLLQPRSLRHAKLRGMYRQGLNRVMELGNRYEDTYWRQRHDVLLASLMESQLRTESGLQRLEKNLEALQQGSKELQEASKDLQQTFKIWLERQNGK